MEMTTFENNKPFALYLKAFLKFPSKEICLQKRIPAIKLTYYFTKI
jgi:hypothetical protein